MNVKNVSPPIVPAVGATAAALLDLGVCLLAIANLTLATQSTQMPLIAGLLFSDLFLIAIAIFQWVMYLRAYVDFRIEQFRQEQPPQV